MRTAAHNGASSTRRLPGFSPSRHAAALVLCLVALLAGYSGTLAKQGVTPEQELAARFAPIIILQRQNVPCDRDGEPYLPAPVDVVFADDDVVLRQGPQQEPVTSPVENADLFDLPDDFATDFPGKPRTPGCDYETHFKAVMGNRQPVVYASVVTEDEQPGVALQYWFFYYFNDFNNLHEGDWEMIQLLFDADSVEEALGEEPTQVAFAQHSGGETADWNAPKLEREGTRPVVYASSGSHASYFGPGLWLGWGENGSGLGCDVTNGDPVRIDPEVRLIPATISGKDDPFAWVTFNGHWGERETWVYDGPTGPALKRQWTAPVSWMEGLRADSIRVNAAGVIGPAPSDIFCGAVENGSALFTLFTPYPLLIIGIVAAGLGIAIWALRQSWQALRETWGVFWPNYPCLRRNRRHLASGDPGRERSPVPPGNEPGFRGAHRVVGGQPGTREHSRCGLVADAGVAPPHRDPGGGAGGGRHRGGKAAGRTPRLPPGIRAGFRILSGRWFVAL